MARWWILALSLVVVIGCKKKPKEEEPEPVSKTPATGHSVTKKGHHASDDDDNGGGKPLEGVTAVSVGGSHACAIADEGKLYCWDGATGTAVLKSDAPGPVQAVANASCALLEDGSLWCWPHHFQVKGGGRDGAAQIAASDSDACASRQLFVWCWKPDDDAPRAQFDWGGIDRLVVGSGRTCSVVTGGEIECRDVASQNGSRPDQIPEVQDVTALAMAWNTICAVHAKGTVECWNDPKQRVTIDGVANASAVALASDGEACAITGGTSVTCWKLALAGPTIERPAAAVSGTSATALGVGNGFACSLGNDKKVRCWTSDGKPQVIAKQ
ncbi:MAG TPA: RCC1 domain-containing protein [Kofleriaceae bacterium]|nr:RCC1 domain-containing protein [Kofleriaceae bacterium]